MGQVVALQDPLAANGSAGGSRVLTAWRADRERARLVERRRLDREAEAHTQRAALANFRRMQPLRARVAPQPADSTKPAFPASASRAFEAGQTDRLTSGWAAHGTGINADLEAALEAMRARSRNWCVNTDMGARYLALVQDNVVGPDAPRLQMRATLDDGKKPDEAANQAIELAFYEWSQRGVCELTGELDLAAVCRAVIAQDARDGEHLVRRVRDERLPHGFAVQLLDTDRIATKTYAAASQGKNSVRLGIETDAYGRKLAVHLLSAHPTDGGPMAPKPMADRVPAGDLFHGFVLHRPEQLRGYPWTSPVLRAADQLATYKQYAMVAAKMGAAKMGFYVTDKDALSNELDVEGHKDATGQLVQDVEAGLLEALPPGVSFESFDPDYPHQNFDAFLLAHERGIAAGLNVAHHNLTGNMTGVNYSSARIAELAERAHWRRVQRWFIESFLRPVFADWLRMALLKRVIVLPGGKALPAERWGKFAAAATFQPRGWSWVDPQADIDASVTAMANDLRSPRQISDETGVDLDEVLQDKARLLARYEELDLPLPQWLREPAAPAKVTA